MHTPVDPKDPQHRREIRDGMLIDWDAPIPMEDGVVLRCDIFRPVEDGLVKHTPAEFAKDAHHWLILHGRYVCKARAPECPRCAIRDLCEFKAKTRALPGL